MIVGVGELAGAITPRLSGFDFLAAGIFFI